MKTTILRIIFVLGLIAIGLVWNGEIRPTTKSFFSTAEAIIGRPMTPMSYAGVARRTTVRLATPGVGTAWNRGGPVNRVGRW